MGPVIMIIRSRVEEVPKIRGTFGEVARIRVIVYWGPLFAGNYHLKPLNPEPLQPKTLKLQF